MQLSDIDADQCLVKSEGLDLSTLRSLNGRGLREAAIESLALRPTPCARRVSCRGAVGAGGSRRRRRGAGSAGDRGFRHSDVAGCSCLEAAVQGRAGAQPARCRGGLRYICSCFFFVVLAGFVTVVRVKRNLVALVVVVLVV